MLAKNFNENACIQDERGACEFFASKLAPTEIARVQPRNSLSLASTPAAVCSPNICARTLPLSSMM